MNSACLISACAVTTRRRNSERHAKYFDKDFEFYYRVKLRKYYHFEPMTLIKVEDNLHSKFCDGSICHSDVLIKPVQTEAKTVGIEKIFTVYSKNCPEGIDKYVEDNLDRYAESGIWTISDKEVMWGYLDGIKRKYNIELDPSSLHYSVQYCWEVEG